MQLDQHRVVGKARAEFLGVPKALADSPHASPRCDTQNTILSPHPYSSCVLPESPVLALLADRLAGQGLSLIVLSHTPEQTPVLGFLLIWQLVLVESGD